MDFEYSDIEAALADNVQRYCENNYTFEKRAALLYSEEGYDRQRWMEFAELGWLGAALPEDRGGFGGGPIANMIIGMAFGRALVVEPFLATASLSLQTLAALPADETTDGLIHAIVDGSRLCALAHSEAQGRGDPEIIETRYEQERLTGAKSLVLNAPSADTILVTARNASGEIGLHLVSPKAAGLTITPYRLLDSSRAADLTFSGTPIEATLATGEPAMRAVLAGHGHALVQLCSEAVGAMEMAIETTGEYLKTRRQFGTTLNNFQSLQHRMADMLVELEMSRSMLFRGFAALSNDTDRAQRDLAAMKALISRSALFVGRNAVQLHGGIGMTEDCSIGHYYRKLFVCSGLFGREDLHLARMAAEPTNFWAE